MNIISFTELEKYKLIKEKENNRDIRLYKLPHCYLTGLTSYYPDVLLKSNINNKFILPIKEMSMSLKKKSYYEENGLYFNQKSYILRFYKNIDVFYFIYNIENYYHFIYDTLPYLFCYLQLKKINPEIKLLMNPKTKLLPFVVESLHLLGIDDILIHKNNTLYKNIYISSSLTHNGLSNEKPRKEIFQIYDLMVQNALNSSEFVNSSKIKKIYISRRTWINKKTDNIGTNYTTRRKLMNEDTLVKLLKKREYNEIFGENYSMVEKIYLFNNADEVMGAIGGTISNCVFCNKDCKIICLVSPDFLNINHRMTYLFNKNVILFEDTKLNCKKGTVSKNVRIEIIKGTQLGEIVEYKNGFYLIKLANNFIGWNQDESYQKILLKRNQFKTLDNGINSPWLVDIDKIKNLIIN